MKWNGSVAIITGASRGIGRSVARAAAARGARVGLIARDASDLADVARACGGGAVAVCDVSARAEVDVAVASLETELGPCTILVNNAGAGAYRSIADTDVEVFENLMRVNYFGALYVTKAVLPGMLARGRGHIVNVASIVGRIAAPMEGAYSASKFAMAAFNDSLAMEVHAKGIGVSLVNPGPVATDFFDARGTPYMRKFPKAVSPDKVADAVMAAVEHNRAEQFVPAWLRIPVALKVLVPSLYARGTRHDFGDEIR